MENLILIKLGGSVITDKKVPFKANRERIRSLAHELKSAMRFYSGKILVAHGSGSFGHVVASKYKTQGGIIDHESIRGLSLVADAAARINRIVLEEFIKAELSVISFSPVSFIFADGQIVKEVFYSPILKALSLGLMPILYGDVIMDQKQGFGVFSGEKILCLLAKYLHKDFRITKLIHVSDTDGVYDFNGKTVPLITSQSIKQGNFSLTGSSAADVTGGMLHKVEESLKIAKEMNISSIIINGNVSGRLKKAILGDRVESTVIES